MQRGNPFVVVLSWGHGYDRGHVVEPLCCLGIGGPYGAATVSADGYAMVARTAAAIRPHAPPSPVPRRLSIAPTCPCLNTRRD